MTKRRWDLETALHKTFGGRAACRTKLYLPWQANSIPHHSQLREMWNVCDTCPVLTECAAAALADKDAGGFWAKVWIPWAWDNGSARNTARARARAMLRHRVAKTPLSEMST